MKKHISKTSFASPIRNNPNLHPPVGDSDTLACITGGIAQAYYKEIPETIITEMRNRLRLLSTAPSRYDSVN